MKISNLITLYYKLRLKAFIIDFVNILLGISTQNV